MATGLALIACGGVTRAEDLVPMAAPSPGSATGAITASTSLSPQSVDEAALMLRMRATADTAVPIGDLDDALATTGSVAPEVASPPLVPPAMQSAFAAADPSPPAAPTPEGAAVSPSTPNAGDHEAGGRILASVKMRAKPDNAAAIVSVLAENAAVTVFACDYWCEVDAAGKRGFVFKKFVKTPAASGERAAEKQEP